MTELSDLPSWSRVCVWAESIWSALANSLLWKLKGHIRVVIRRGAASLFYCVRGHKHIHGHFCFRFHLRAWIWPYIHFSLAQPKSPLCTTSISNFLFQFSPLSCLLRCFQYTIAEVLLSSCCPVKKRTPTTTKQLFLLFPPCLRPDPFVSHFVPTLPRFFFFSPLHCPVPSG